MLHPAWHFTPVFLGFSCDSAGKESACKVGDLGLIPGLGRYSGKGKGYPLQYSGLENSMGLQRVGHDWAAFPSRVCHNPSQEKASFTVVAAVTTCSDFGAQEKKICSCFHVSPICHEVMRPDAMIFVFWMLSFNSAFSLSSFTLIKKLFSSLLLSVIRVLSCAYLRLLIFLPAILFPAYDSSSLASLMMYSAYTLLMNTQVNSIQP